MAKGSITAVARFGTQESKHRFCAGSLSADGRSAYFVNAVSDSRFGARVAAIFETCFKELSQSLYVEKRDYKLTSGDESRALIRQKVGYALRDALSLARIESRNRGDRIDGGLTVFFATGVGDSFFAGKIGRGSLVEIVSEQGVALKPVLTMKSEEPSVGGVEVFETTMNERSPIVFAAGIKGTLEEHLPALARNPARSLPLLLRGSGRDRGAAVLAFQLGTAVAASRKPAKSIAARLAKSSLFKDLSKEELGAVLSIGELREFAAGEELYREGAPGESILVLLGGTIQVRASGVEIAKRSIEGETFGESGFLEGHPRSGSLHAETEVRVIEIMNEPLWDLIKARPELGVKVLARIASNSTRKLRETTRELMEYRRRRK